MFQTTRNFKVLANAGGSNGAVMDNNINGHIMDSLQQQQQQNANNNGTYSQQQQPSYNKQMLEEKAYVKITEQPASKALRFRYECEGRSAGSIPGENSTPENKTYPTIEVVGCKGRAVVVVSCVTKDQPYRPHPHNLVGKEGCKKGVCTLEINSGTMKAVFSNLGIQCVKKKDIDAALKSREEIRVDPFKTGFSHRFQPSSIDMNSVRLCFQVFMEDDQKGRFTHPLAPVVSEPIYDKKAMSDLIIFRLCSCSASVLGNTQIILLCEKVAKEDISVRFYEENNGQVIWEAFGEFQHTDVHKQTAISFKTPRYRNLDITEPAKVFIQLKRPSDGATSEPLPFEYIPMDSDPAHLKRKRKKTNGDPLQLLLQQQQNQHQNDCQDNRQDSMSCWKTLNIPAIKTEPKDTSPQSFVRYNAPMELSPSPQTLSPTSTYNHNIPPPFSTTTTAIPGSQRLISPTKEYNATNTMPGGVKYDSTHADVYDPNANRFSTNSVLTSTTAAGGGSAGDWSSPVNCYHPHQMQRVQQVQRRYPQFQALSTAAANNNNDGGLTNVTVSAKNANNANNNSENYLSNLLTLDSDQLVHINSEDQQMLRLESEDLQI